MRKSNGTTRGSESAVLMSCESWKRCHDAGTMNLCDGSWYIVFVLNTTGIEGCVAMDEDAAMLLGEEMNARPRVFFGNIFRPGRPSSSLNEHHGH
jgi:hypothetical protein